MKITIPGKYIARPIHHALKVALPAQLASLVIGEVEGRHWSFPILQWTLFGIAIISAVAAIIHVGVADMCGKCRPTRPALLGTRRYRAYAAYGRTAFWVLLVAKAVEIVSYPLLFGKGGLFPQGADWAADDRHFNPVSMPYNILWYSAAALYLSADRLNTVNNTGRTGPTPVGRWLVTRGTRLLHRSHYLVAAMAVALLALVAFAPVRDSSVWGSALMLGAVLLYTSSELNQRHGMTLCTDCGTSMRADAAEYAQKREWRLRLVHRSGYAILITLAMIILSAFADGAWWGSACLGVILTMAVAMAFLARFHGSYLPWCPVCRRGGGGHHHEPVPDPSGDSGRPLPVA